MPLDLQAREVRPAAYTHTFAAALILVFAALHFWLALRFPLAPDETYYWEWSRRPAWGYYDQGPMIAWWIRGSCLLFGETQIGIRLPIILAFSLTQWFVFLLARDISGTKSALLAILLIAITPMALAGGFIATYDPLVILFWAAALYFASRAVLFENSAAWWGLGISFGLGLLSKHTMILLAPCLLVFLVTSRYRIWLRRPQPYAAFILGILIFAPNLVWQSQHDWMTFGHLFNLTGKGTDHSFARRLGDFAGSQVFLVSPLLFVGFLAAVIRARGNDEAMGGVRLLFWTSAPILLLFLAMTVKSKVQANWATTGWVTPPILFAVWLRDGGANLRKFAWVAGGFCCILSALLVLPELRAALGIRIPPKWDQMNKLHGGVELGKEIDAARRSLETETGTAVKVGSTTYDATSRISFYTPGQPEACNLFLGTRPNSYLLWVEDNCPAPGDNMVLSDDHGPDEEGRPPFEAVFERVSLPEDGIQVVRQGVYDAPVHVYYLYRCYNYKPNPQVEHPAGFHEP